MRTVERHAQMAGALGDADRRPRKPASFEVDGREEVPGKVGGVIEIGGVGFEV